MSNSSAKPNYDHYMLIEETPVVNKKSSKNQVVARRRKDDFFFRAAPSRQLVSVQPMYNRNRAREARTQRRTV